jgi:uncharacterized protein YjbJ (UPF0337 family)
LITLEKATMNKHQIKGTVKAATGRVQQAAGRLAGSGKHEAKGMAKEAAGRTQKAYGDGKEAMKKSPRSRPAVKH